MRHTAASVERVLFTDCRLRRLALKAWKNERIGMA
jgi:hypothetical protein